MSNETKLTGSCLCQGIRYEVSGKGLGDIMLCHCQRCRKANGTAYAANAPVHVHDFKIISGEHLLQTYQSTPITQRSFCRECGSPIISLRMDAPELYRLRIGTLDTKIEQTPKLHIFTASKAEWENICDELPQYAERP